MKSENITVKVKLLGKEYPVSCSRSEEGALLQASRYLEDKMREIRNAGKTIGLDRIAIMAALNLAHEFIKLQDEMEEEHDSSHKKLETLMEKVDTVLDDV